MVIYRITTTGNDLQHDYSRVSSNWQFVSFTRSEDGERMERWTCETDRPGALEGLLNTDREVGVYASDDYEEAE